jgi:hypothetical protein
VPRSIRMWAGWKRITALTLALCSIRTSTVRAQLPAADEMQIRAAIVLNLTKFIDWPTWKLGDTQTPFVICLLGSDPIITEIETLIRDKQVQDKPIMLRHLTSTSQVDGCHVLYVPTSEHRRFSELIATLNKSSVLTISDQKQTGEGAVISLPVIDNRVQIQVDLRAAQHSGLTVSSKLLRIATVTR